ncbi:response regulator [Rodentibacter heidelbergensis]|uniref:Response regulator n=1 Tax=Rodentibacter heidelbergensis TaxID=1908258 RepID=A0A1V3I8P3_9PAST|nr:response regulator [Rodentibacter heidelbergensis]OOF36454.1 response regulator [Rodentibacter heidelbergensis]
MSDMKLLLVEDHKQDQDLCQDAVRDFNDDNDVKVDLKICGSLIEAEEKLKSSDFDGAIIDMKLTDTGGAEGNEVIKRIKENFNRIPVVIMTGTPNVAERNDFPLIGVYEKGGDVTYSDIIKKFGHIYSTGLTKIMGGRGIIERKLTTIFTHILTQSFPDGNDSEKKSWIKYAESDPTRTEKALLRYTLNHLLYHLDNDVSSCYPEEMYISPPVNDRINTGCILKDKISEQYYIVMNPVCDLAERSNGGCNTDRALLVEIQSIEEILPKGITEKQLKNELEKIYRNKKSLYYHWLPETSLSSPYIGGVINFRRVSTHTKEQINDSFEKLVIQVAAPFLKDIVSRFSSYYARQGQPDIDIELLK